MRTLRSNNRASVVFSIGRLTRYLLHCCTVQTAGELLPQGALDACAQAPWLQPFRLLCWLAKQSFSVASDAVWGRHANCSPIFVGASVLHAASYLNPSRPKRGSRRPRESSELRREGFWCGQ